MSLTRVSSRELAAALAARLARSTPEGIRVFSEEANVVVATDTHRVGVAGAAVIVDSGDGRSAAERLETASRAVLSAVQDYIVDELARPWPEGGNVSQLALPDSQVVGEELRMWFGDANNPVLRLEPFSECGEQ